MLLPDGVINTNCQIPRQRQTNKQQKQIYKETRPFVCLMCLSGASILWLNAARCLTEILRGGGEKNPGSTKYKYYEIWSVDYQENQWYYCHQMSPFKARMHQIWFLAFFSVLSLCLFVCVLDRVRHKNNRETPACTYCFWSTLYSWWPRQPHKKNTDSGNVRLAFSH